MAKSFRIHSRRVASLKPKGQRVTHGDNVCYPIRTGSVAVGTDSASWNRSV